MSIGLNASQARSKSQQDLTVFDETIAIMRSVITASEAGRYETIIDSGTIMTESNPVSVITGTIVNPSVSYNSTLIIDNNIITLGISGTHLNAIISDINDAAIPSITASKQDNKLVISVVHTQESTWTYQIGDGTANASIGLTEGIYASETPNSTAYFDVWQGLSTDRGLDRQMNAVLSHFNNLGYKIERLMNMTTNKTFKWYLYW